MTVSKLRKTGLLPRLAAWEVLKSVSAGSYAEKALERSINKYAIKETDRALVIEIAFGSIRRRKTLDCWIDYLGKVPFDKQPPLLRWLLHIGLYQILFMQRIPAPAAVDITVQLAKENKLGKLAAVANGILRSALRAKESGVQIPLPSAPSGKLAVEASLPIWLAENLIAWHGEIDAGLIAKACNQVPPFDLRVNRLITNRTNLQNEFSYAGIETNPIDGCPDGLQVINGAGNIMKWPGYREGKWSVQDRSAQWVVPLLAPSAGERVLDACSAPGGKTTHIAELMANKGEIWAVDRSLGRLKKVIINSARLRCDCVKTLTADSTALLKIKPHWHSFFDKILVDAPCSGLGTLARNPDARWRINPLQIGELVTLQLELLEELMPLLRPGGIMVYSTCTIHPDENTSLINEFVDNHMTISLKTEKQILPDPSRGGDGFYAAVLQIAY